MVMQKCSETKKLGDDQGDLSKGTVLQSSRDQCIDFSPELGMQAETQQQIKANRQYFKKNHWKPDPSGSYGIYIRPRISVLS
jgi:hypothetical protein